MEKNKVVMIVKKSALDILEELKDVITDDRILIKVVEDDDFDEYMKLKEGR